MTPLERRYRRLLWLLPAAERRARGEELVGVLTDVDAGRSWPSPAEALALTVLAVRLHLARYRAALTLALTALLVAAGTQPAGRWIDAYTADAFEQFLALYRDEPPLSAVGVLTPLLAAVAWTLGAVRAATALFALAAVETGYWYGQFILAHGLFDPAETVYTLARPAMIVLLLGGAWWRRWAPPRPRVMWLLLVPVCVAGWAGLALSGRHGIHGADPVPFAIALLWIAAVAHLVGRRRRTATAVPRRAD